MGTACIVPCGRKKIWDNNPNAGPTESRYVYKGSFTNKCREYAEHFYPNSWYIISAKYGFLSPDDIIPGPYDVCFYNKSTNPITVNELIKKAEEKNLYDYDRFVILAPKTYTQIISKIFPETKLVTPLEGLKGIGYMMHKINNSIITDQPFI